MAFLFTLFTDAAARALVVPGVSRGILGERITLGKAWSITYPRIPQMLLFYLLVALIGIGIGLAFWALSATGAEVLVVLLVLACVPGILLAVVFVGVAVSAIVLERISAAASFRRASALMRGSAWRLIGNFFVIYLVVSMITGAINGVPPGHLHDCRGVLVKPRSPRGCHDRVCGDLDCRPDDHLLLISRFSLHPHVCRPTHPDRRIRYRPSSSSRGCGQAVGVFLEIPSNPMPRPHGNGQSRN